MLIQIDPRQNVKKIPGRAHIVIAIQTDGTLHMQAFRQGALNAAYANRLDSVLAQIPTLLAELREELAIYDAQPSVAGS